MLVESKEIPKEVAEIYISSKYEVFTVIPSPTSPVMNTYIFTQEELEAFLKDYTRHGELVISVKQVQATA